jgi:hypothetical protein
MDEIRPVGSMGLNAGVRWQFADGIAGGAYDRTDGLEEFEANPKYGGAGTGEDGDDFGFSAEVGLGPTFAERWDTTLYAKYYNSATEAVPASEHGLATN